MITPEQTAAQFLAPGDAIAVVAPHGRGIIHDTYLVRLKRNRIPFILQRINTRVFPNPELLMHNLQLVSEHVLQQRKLAGNKILTEWQMACAIPTRDSKQLFRDTAGEYWRALHFIRGAHPLERITCIRDVREVGRALGIFHALLSDLAPGLLHETLPAFHNVEQYLKHYDAVVANSRQAGPEENFCQESIASRRRWAPVLEEARRRDILQRRIIHGDPKINNIMIDRITGRAVSIVDLDTVMPGLIQYDVGDCLRSCCNITDEEGGDVSAAWFDLERCRAFLEGYVYEARSFLTEMDLDYFFDAARLLPFELGLRFYTDFLEGNVYFRARTREQNLRRAAVQFTLMQSIEKQEEKIRDCIAECRPLIASN